MLNTIDSRRLGRINYRRDPELIMQTTKPPRLQTISRRFLFQGGALAAGTLLVPGARHSLLAGQAAPTDLAPLNRFPRMVQEYMVGQVRALYGERLERLAGLKNRQEAEDPVADSDGLCQEARREVSVQAR